MEVCEQLIKETFPQINEDIYAYVEGKWLIGHIINL